VSRGDLVGIGCIFSPRVHSCHNLIGSSAAQCWCFRVGLQLGLCIENNKLQEEIAFGTSIWPHYKVPLSSDTWEFLKHISFPDESTGSYSHYRLFKVCLS